MTLLRGTALGYQRLSTRDRRALFVGLAILLPALLWAGALRPYQRALLEVREHLAAERALLEREYELIARADELPHTMERARLAAHHAETRLVRAANAPLAEAEVTAYLEKMAALSRVLLDEIRGVDPPRGSVPPAGLRPIRLALAGESDLEGVITLLHRIENSPLLLRLAEFSLQPAPAATGGRDTQSTAVMQFALVVESFAPDDRADLME